MKSAAKLGLLVLSCLVAASGCERSEDGAPAATHEWAWIAGAQTVDEAGVYGTQGTAAATNVPGAREEALSWRDPAGVFWLFGGYGYDATGLRGRLNDLWKFDPSAGQWTWLSGDETIDGAGLYGTRGVPSAANVPGARNGAVAWTDPLGGLWLFGGQGFAGPGDYGNLNDLWTYDRTSGEWTWVAGSNATGQAGVYGTQGTPGPLNVPGARIGAVAWTDADGQLWLFGGYGLDAAGARGWLNDLWRFDPAAAEWTWIRGGVTVDQTGVYGTKGELDPANIPGSRQSGAAWLDSAGHVWLFGGYGFDSAGERGDLNDLWRFRPDTLEWSWIFGSNVKSAVGVYGTLGTAATSNVPGARELGLAWIDSAGDLWLFGGYGYDASGLRGWLNDLWRFDLTDLQWAWTTGSSSGGQAGAYGTQGTADPLNAPGARYAAASWIDGQDRLWLFGGYGQDSAAAGGRLNDLWRVSKISN
jgi:N-acetylneuraminic acid mutarotase